MSSVRRSIGFSVVSLISLILPMGIVAWSIYAFFMSFVEPLGTAAVKNGEIWFAELHSTEFGPLPPSFSCQVKCRDLTTGIERPTGIQIENDCATPLWVGEDLYLIGASGIFQYSNEARKTPGERPLKQVDAIPTSGITTPEMSVFLYHGELTTCVEGETSGCRLVHLREGRWVDGRKFRQPPVNCDWYDHPDDGRKMLQPASPGSRYLPAMPMGLSFKGAAPIPFLSNTIVGLAPVTTITQVSSSPLTVPLPATPVDPPAPVPVTTDSVNENEPKPENAASNEEPLPAAPAAVTSMTVPLPWTPAPTWTFQVAQEGDHVHIFLLNDSGFCAYRDGFDFEDETESGVSALDAENVIRDPRGWEPIPLIPSGNYIQQMVCDRDGALFSSLTLALIRRDHSGVWSTVTGLKAQDSTSAPQLLVDSSENRVYVMEDSGEILQVAQNSVQPTCFKVTDRQQVYLGRWLRLMLGLIGAWLLHNALVSAGTEWLLHNAGSISYQFGNQQVTLASFGRRGLAASIDFAILATILFLSFWIHSRFLGLHFGHVDKKHLVESLTMLESSVMYEGFLAIPELVDQVITILSQVCLGGSDFSPLLLILLTVMVDTGVVLWGLKVFDEGRYGVTPGKRLLGIQTVRTTLRKSGFARALVRDILNSVDLLGFLTQLPAAASVTFSSNRQRWGDRVADTIVINSKSLITHSSSDRSRDDTESKPST